MLIFHRYSSYSICIFIRNGGKSKSCDSLPSDCKFKLHRKSPMIEGRNKSPHEKKIEKKSTIAKVAIFSNGNSIALLRIRFIFSVESLDHDSLEIWRSSFVYMRLGCNRSKFDRTTSFFRNRALI